MRPRIHTRTTPSHSSRSAFVKAQDVPPSKSTARKSFRRSPITSQKLPASIHTVLPCHCADPAPKWMLSIALQSCYPCRCQHIPAPSVKPAPATPEMQHPENLLYLLQRFIYIINETEKITIYPPARSAALASDRFHVYDCQRREHLRPYNTADPPIARLLKFPAGIISNGPPPHYVAGTSILSSRQTIELQTSSHGTPSTRNPESSGTQRLRTRRRAFVTHRHLLKWTKMSGASAHLSSPTLPLHYQRWGLAQMTIQIIPLGRNWDHTQDMVPAEKRVRFEIIRQSGKPIPLSISLRRTSSTITSDFNL